MKKRFDRNFPVKPFLFLIAILIYLYPIEGLLYRP